MPELPEVRIITKQLQNLLKGNILRDIRISGPHEKFSEDISKIRPLLKSKINPVKFGDIKCKGKFIYFEILFYENLEVKDIKYIGNHLGMTGHWRKDKGSHTMVELLYSNSDILYFDDMRHFGKFYWLTRDQLDEKLKSLGPDVLSDEFTEKVFDKIMKSPENQNKIIGIALVDQSIMSGIGNYLRADILYTAQIYPGKKIKDINSEHLKALYSAIRNITNKSYLAHGTTIRTYSDIEMNPGDYDPIIYGKKHDPLGNSVSTMSLGRTMWYVKALQK